MPVKSILLFCDWFEPGYKAGGPIRSCVNFARHMKEGYRVFVFTADRDLHDKNGYPGIPINSWTSFEPGIEVYYSNPSARTWKNIRAQWELIRPDFVYLNSMFSLHFTIFPMLIAKSRETKNYEKIILAPRGMLKSSALSYKKTKKQVFLRLFGWLGLQHLVEFHATDNTEVKDIKQFFGNRVRIAMAGNFPGYIGAFKPVLEKVKGSLKMVFIGRVHPIKNLYFLISALKHVHGSVILTVIGGEEDKDYARQCRHLAAGLREGILVNFAGEVPNKNVRAVLDAHHIFALPTNGENFGHAIFEALAAGKPVLISDQTPWRQLEEQRAGWDLPLQHPEQFSLAIKKAVDFDQYTYNQWSESSWQFVNDYVNKNNLLAAYQRIFN